MNAVMTFATASDQLQRYDAIRRKNAESAYDRNVQYNGQNQKTLVKLEALLMEKDEPQIVQPEHQELQELGAGQMKQVILPIGKTLEETIDFGGMCGRMPFLCRNQQPQIINLQLQRLQKLCKQKRKLRYKNWSNLNLKWQWLNKKPRLEK